MNTNGMSLLRTLFVIGLIAFIGAMSWYTWKAPDATSQPEDAQQQQEEQLPVNTGEEPPQEEVVEEPVAEEGLLEPEKSTTEDTDEGQNNTTEDALTEEQQDSSTEDAIDDTEQEPATEEVNENTVAEASDHVVEVTEDVDVYIEAKKYEFTPAMVDLQVGQRVTIHMTSVDVEHGITIPDFQVDLTVPAGETKTTTFIVNRSGNFPFFSNVYAGPGTNRMRGMIIVSN